MNLKCPHCGYEENKSKKVKGKRVWFYNIPSKKDPQRFKCLKCDRTFTKEKNYVAKSKREKELIAALLELLNINGAYLSDSRYWDFSELYLSSERQIGEKEIKNISSIKIKRAAHQYKRQWSAGEIRCNAPRVILSLVKGKDGDEIKIVLIPHDYFAKDASEDTKWMRCKLVHTQE